MAVCVLTLGSCLRSFEPGVTWDHLVPEVTWCLRVTWAHLVPQEEAVEMGPGEKPERERELAEKLEKVGMETER